MAHGNDGGGSIRIPSSYCGLFGLKPSRGRIPSGSEVMRMWETMVVEHVLTRSVRDSAAMLDVLSGPVVGSSIALPKPEASFLQGLEQPLRPLRMGFTEVPFFPATVDEQMGDYLGRATHLCQDLGHQVEPVSLKIDSIEVARAYVIVIAGEMAASIKRLSDIMGHKAKHADLERATAVICHIGDYLSAADFAWAGDVLESASRDMAGFFEEYDVLITPTMPSPPPLVGTLGPDFIEQGVLELLTHVPFVTLLQKALDHAAARNFAYYPFTPIFNISGQPAMSVPLYWDQKGLPVGIQFAGRVGGEGMLLQLARQLEVACPWADKRPSFESVSASS
jgi:amidase